MPFSKWPFSSTVTALNSIQAPGLPEYDSVEGTREILDSVGITTDPNFTDALAKPHTCYDIDFIIPTTIPKNVESLAEDIRSFESVREPWLQSASTGNGSQTGYIKVFVYGSRKMHDASVSTGWTPINFIHYNEGAFDCFPNEKPRHIDTTAILLSGKPPHCQFIRRLDALKQWRPFKRDFAKV